MGNESETSLAGLEFFFRHENSDGSTLNPPFWSTPWRPGFSYLWEGNASYHLFMTTVFIQQPIFLRVREF